MKQKNAKKRKRMDTIPLTTEVPFWLRPVWPQYRKIVNGEEMLLDGTETGDTEIVKYDYSDEYKACLAAILNQDAEPELPTK